MAKKPKTAKSAQSAWSIGISAKKSVEERVAALANVSLAVHENEDNLAGIVKVLGNESEPKEVRLAALEAIELASFSSMSFEACRGDYMATLRKVVQDPDSDLRERALSILASERDGFVQKKLLQGLEAPDKALVPPEKALQLLSYDIHADAYPLARAIVSKPPSAAARREALRLLAADAGSAKLFEKILRDKKETSEVRNISATALQSIKPEKLYAHGKEILLDDSEYDDIRATCLTALTQFADSAVGEDKALLEKLQHLKAKASAKVKKGASQLLKKYGS